MPDKVPRQSCEKPSDFAGRQLHEKNFFFNDPNLNLESHNLQKKYILQLLKRPLGACCKNGAIFHRLPREKYLILHQNTVFVAQRRGG